MAHTASEDRIIWKRSTVLLLRRPTSKCSCATGSGNRGLSSSLLSSSSLVDLQLSNHGARAGGWSKADATVAAGGALLASGPVTPGATTPIAVSLPGRGVTSLVVRSRRYVARLPFSFSGRAYIVFFLVPSRNICCREVLPGFVVAKALGFVDLPIRPGPS